MFAPATTTLAAKSSTCSWVSCVFVSVAAIVIESPEASVVRVMLLPATNVKVSVAPSATTSDCPDTDIVLNASVTVPVAVTVASIAPSASESW